MLWPPVASGLELRVRDNHLVDGRDRVIRLLGVNRSGAEYACIQGWGFFDGPTDRHSIRAMKSSATTSARWPAEFQCRIQGGLKNSSFHRPHFGQRCSGSTGVPHFRQCGFIGTMLLRGLTSKT